MGINLAGEYLGRRARDRVTGFEGIVTGWVEYFGGAQQALIQPRVDAEGKLREGNWVDLPRVELIGPETDATTIK